MLKSSMKLHLLPFRSVRATTSQVMNYTRDQKTPPSSLLRRRHRHKGIVPTRLGHQLG
uniref:Uncharacterized protein n=1 Tax=Arundo donax TaxID=35708 RepID=A0A0A9BYD6_ARUDO